MKVFFDNSRKDLEAYCESLGVSKVHATALSRTVYKQFNFTPWNLQGIPNLLKERLREDFSFAIPKIREERISEYDNTAKLLLELEDGKWIECVIMPEKNRITLCVSSQVGCKLGCVFCCTGKIGFKRNLKPSEIIGQLIVAYFWLRDHPEWLDKCRLPHSIGVTNIVFMGMGEPFDNVDSLIKSVDILSDQLCYDYSLRRISVSTVGLLPGMQKFLERFPKASLALSLHASSDEARSKLIPANRKWPINKVLDYLRVQRRSSKRDVLVQYALISGQNDSKEDAERLVKLFEGLSVKINIIPLNESGEECMSSPDPQSLQSFRDIIHASGIRALVRFSKGQDVEAACGQLVAKMSNES